MTTSVKRESARTAARWWGDQLRNPQGYYSFSQKLNRHEFIKVPDKVKQHASNSAFLVKVSNFEHLLEDYIYNKFNNPPKPIIIRGKNCQTDRFYISTSSKFGEADPVLTTIALIAGFSPYDFKCFPGNRIMRINYDGFVYVDILPIEDHEKCIFLAKTA